MRSKIDGQEKLVHPENIHNAVKIIIEYKDPNDTRNLILHIPIVGIFVP